MNSTIEMKTDAGWETIGESPIGFSSVTATKGAVQMSDTVEITEFTGEYNHLSGVTAALAMMARSARTFQVLSVSRRAGIWRITARRKSVSPLF